MAMAVACSAIAMEALQIHLLPHRQSLSHGFRLPIPARSRPAQRLLLHIVGNLPGQGKDQKNLHSPGHVSEQRRKILSKFREDRRKKRSFRLSLRARLRLLVRALSRWSPSALAPLLLRGFPLHNRTLRKQVALSLLMACTLSLGLLCFKVTSVPSPHSVRYSDLVKYLDSGAVSSVLFEEGSRRVLFNLKPGEETPENGLRNPTLPHSGSSVKKLIIANRDPVTVYSDGNVVDGSEMEATISAPNEIPTAIEEDMFKHLQSGTLQSSTQVDDETVNGIDINSPSQTHGETTDTTESIDELSSPHNSDGAMGRKKEWEVIKSIGASFKSVLRIPEQMLKAEPRPWQYVTRRIENDEAYLLGLMREKGVSYRSAPQSMSASLRATLFTILSLWIPLAPLFWLMYKQFSSSNSSAQRKHLGSIAVKFKDVAGVDEAKAELVEIVSCLRGTMDFRRLGAKLPKGVLLVGPPGTGKTLLARAVAGEAGVPFFAASASEFVEMFVGRGAARIRELFSSARKYSPSIIFIDELDAVGGRRGRSFNDERDQTLNQLLTEMDGFESETGVLVIAATNRAEALDPALCRPGRFSRKVFVREPDFNGRQQILAVHMRGVPIEGDVKAAQSIVASITVGFVGADLANVVNEAALLAVRTGREAVTIEDLKEAVDRVKFGVGNKPTISGAVERMFDWLQQPKAMKSPPSGYEAPSWNG